MTKRLAIVGGGSSGLITLKHALDELQGWEIVCFEKSSSVTGCWGSPPDGFVSTSTRYTTQFASFPRFDAGVQPRDPDARQARARCPEFFCDQEYGEYLSAFADHFELRPYIQVRTAVDSVRRVGGTWRLLVTRDGQSTEETFDAVALCTGLVDEVREADCEVETLHDWRAVDDVRGRKIVVVGGGESGVDMANRLAHPELANEVYLSLRSGIRVSPRYHPIRGVPSDFLRNRLLLSFDPGLRNTIGGGFVAARIRFQETFEKLFPHRVGRRKPDDMSSVDRRKHWDLRLTRAAKGKLFDVYHNKTDDFLEAVGEGRISIIGSNVDSSYREFFEFQSPDRRRVDPDLVVPAIGYRNGLEALSSGEIRLKDFFLGCVHVSLPSLFAVGFARPVIGNIPSMSEMQARLAMGILSGRVDHGTDRASEHDALRTELEERFSSLDTEAAYPVEMFPYCDELSRRLGSYPSRANLRSWGEWVRVRLEPASTRHYLTPEEREGAAAPIYSPWVLTFLLLLLKPLDFVVRAVRSLRSRRRLVANPAPLPQPPTDTDQ